MKTTDILIIGGAITAAFRLAEPQSAHAYGIIG